MPITPTEDRKRYLDLILKSTAKKKIIVAGPGTGKSFTFHKLLETKTKNNLAVTFINNLANDLQKELGEFAESHTFHGFCKKLLHKISVDGIDQNFHYFPKLPQLIESDAEIIKGRQGNFEKAFRTLMEDNRISFYLEQGNYYNATSHNDAVYRVLKYFQSEGVSLPSFCQIVVDEYQDFNLLEVTFINELAKSSPILIVGDDDQAIYGFKNASADYIRKKASHKDFERFELPYCSRCTQVIVDAVHDITSKAEELGKLSGRIKKKYSCFLPDKKADSVAHPKIIHAQCSTHTKKAPYISRFIEQEIKSISQDEIDSAREKGYPCVLIAGPSHYTKQIYQHLKGEFSNIDYPDKKNNDINIIEGYKFIMGDENSNLGWRIILEHSDSKLRSKIVTETYKSKKKNIELLDGKFKNEHLNIVKLLKKVRSGNTLSKQETSLVTSRCQLSLEDIKTFLGISPDEDGGAITEDNTISIKITTISGTKGLSADYVFLVAMNNGDFPENHERFTDNEISQFIVGLTRTRKKCYLISNSYGFGSFEPKTVKSKSIFIDWINPKKIDEMKINKDFWQ